MVLKQGYCCVLLCKQGYCCCVQVYCCDRKSRAACAQSFALCKQQ